jgi:hypothetical protein
MLSLTVSWLKLSNSTAAGTIQNRLDLLLSYPPHGGTQVSIIYIGLFL